MQSEKRIKDIMTGIFEYPHIPYWFTISQAIKIIKVSFVSPKKYPDPLAVLVFDEKYNLMGTLTIKDILNGLEPRFLKPSTTAQVPEENQTTLSHMWDDLFDQNSKLLADKPVSEIIVPAKLFVGPDDPIAKAAYLMLDYNLILMPVLENKRKLIGLVRMIEVFDEISNSILKE